MEIITAMATAIGGILSTIAVSPAILGVIAFVVLATKAKRRR